MWGQSSTLAKSNGSCIVSIDYVNVLRLVEKENKTLAGIARGDASATGEVLGFTCLLTLRRGGNSSTYLL